MKKNWKIIGLLVAFMALWQYFVITPYTDKIKTKQVVEDTNEVATQSAATETDVRTNVSDQSPTNAQATKVQVTDKFVEYQLNNDIRFRIHSNAVVSSFYLENYQKHDGSKDNVVLAESGFAWTSSNQQIQNCLNILQSTNSEENKIFKAKSTNGTCEVSYGFIEHKKVKELVPTLVLKGFAGAQGSVEFSNSDSSFYIKEEGSSEYELVSGYTQNPTKLYYFSDEDTDEVSSSDLLSTNTVQGKFAWISFGDKYFTTLMLPKGMFNPNLFHSFNAGEFNYGVRYPIVSEGLTGGKYELGFYAGPRDAEILASIDPKLEAAIDLGFFESVARFMLWALNALFALVRNYGMAIILLTVIVRILFWPLNKKMFESGHKMKALQPQMEKIKAKYKGDKSKMNEMNMEIMGLYKTHKVNPLGSCFPLLLQMPVFFGLYIALSNSIELYQAPFFGWIQDLSSPDPYYVLPVVWTVSMYFTMKLNPQTSQTQPGMPNMKPMMYIMYLVFGFLAKDWPAGLNLYLVVSNVVGVAQQFFFQRSSQKAELIQEGAN